MLKPQVNIAAERTEMTRAGREVHRSLLCAVRVFSFSTFNESAASSLPQGRKPKRHRDPDLDAVPSAKESPHFSALSGKPRSGSRSRLPWSPLSSCGIVL